MNFFTNSSSGLARVRFELSTIPEHKGQGPILVLRILEFLTPLQTMAQEEYEPFVLANPGELLMRRTRHGIHKTWSYPLDKRQGGILWKEFLAASNS